MVYQVVWQWISLIAQIISAFSNITLNVFLIARMEVLGAALATTIVEFILPLALFFPSLTYLKSLDNLFGILQALCGSILMYLVLHASCLAITNPLLQIFASVLLGSLVYAACEILFRNRTALYIVQMLTKKLQRKRS